MASITSTPRNISFENAQQLVGELEPNGLATLSIDKSSSSPKSMKVALEAVAKGESNSDTASTASEEDYDNLKHDPLAVVAGGKGGGFDGKASETSPVIAEKVYQDIKAPNGKKSTRPAAQRMQSIPITLKKSEIKGKYFLVADEKELKGILKMGAARVRLHGHCCGRN